MRSIPSPLPLPNMAPVPTMRAMVCPLILISLVLQRYFSGPIYIHSRTLSPLMVALLSIPAPPSWNPTTTPSHIRPTLQRSMEQIIVHAHALCHLGALLGLQDGNLLGGARVGERMTRKHPVSNLLAAFLI